MRFLRNIIDGVWLFFETIFGWVDNIPGLLRPVTGWIRDRIEDVVNALLAPVYLLRDIEWWSGLIHEAVSYILEWADIRDELARVFEIPEWTWNNVILRIADGFIYIIAFANDKRQALFDSLKPAILATWAFLGWTSDQWKFLISMVLNEIVNTTTWFWDNFQSHVWGRLVEPLGPLEQWLEGQADNLRDNILRLGDWFGEQLGKLDSLPASLMDVIFWQLLVSIKRAGKEFTLFLLDITSSVLPFIAWPVVKLGEQILDFVWESKEGD